METQRSGRRRPQLLLLLPHAVLLDRPLTNKALSTPQLLLEAFLLALTVFFLVVRLETRVRRDGIYVRYVPPQGTFRRYGWGSMARAYRRPYGANSEYRGWGLLGSSPAATVAGEWGLQLVFTDGEKLLIGTQKPEQLQETLRQLGQLKR